jgi:hypothetical protein
MPKTHAGGCYCGAVEIEVRGEPLEMGYCHCENCRRYSAAPVSAFTLWKWENVNLIKGADFLGKFKSSDISDRRYCTKCGSHISVDHPTLGLIDVRLGALRNFPFTKGAPQLRRNSVADERRFAQAQRFSRINRRLRRDRIRVRPQFRGIRSGWEPADRW